MSNLFLVDVGVDVHVIVDVAGFQLLEQKKAEYVYGHVHVHGHVTATYC